MKKDGSRMTQSSDLCGTCHGEPRRHGRYQQWQLSRHGNYETARAEGTNASCAKCHSSQGFIQWANNGFGTKPITVDWTTDDVHRITCAACHDAHAIGTTSGNDATNATVRIAGTTPKLDAGFTVNGAGRGAICMACHNGRRGLKNDQVALTDFSRAPHVGPQTDILVGQNLYFAKVGEKGNHAAIEDTCVVCHMETSDPPPTLANYSNGVYGGTNHSFYAQPDICTKCHTAITLEEVQHNVEAKMESLKASIETALKNLMQTQIRLGNAIDIGEFRSNIFVTNGGTTPAEVAITLFNSSGQSLISYKLSVPAGQVLQDPEPFRNRANAGDLGWGFATATVTKGANVHVLGSMIDQKTNDPTTVHARQ